MAAILCQGIGSLCSGVGYCCTIPCRACGGCCGDCCGFFTKVLTSPFTPYLLTTIVLNLPPFVWGLRAFLESQGVRCHGDVWLWVNSGFSLVHMLAAVYIVHRVQQEKSAAATAEVVDTETAYQSMQKTSNEASTTAGAPKQEAPKSMADNLLWSVASAITAPSKKAEPRDTTATYLGNDYDDGESNSFQRLKQVFCYDLVVAIYMIATVFWCIWQSIGISQILFPEDQADNAEVCDDIGNW
eukprot:CAMPEP_0198144004 /NCGR_PEP_ID=MMETSP1443-20131203/12353_1 /TAXON_ID=186043 /ORGANISM="Entomoneis sp., Strain CCMP2396" /LENGTH=241 /DNA_ID=CAMNT_0043807321 /DNA_START=173 /DNA_END=895 /DNA_ORIENTATION=-